MHSSRLSTACKNKAGFLQTSASAFRTTNPNSMSMETFTALSLHQCNFEQFGTAILPVDDMTPHSSCDAELKFNGANLRYYVMRLRRRPAVLGSMTRHTQATQCLSSADAQPWWLAVAAAKLHPNNSTTAPCNW